MKRAAADAAIDRTVAGFVLGIDELIGFYREGPVAPSYIVEGLAKTVRRTDQTDRRRKVRGDFGSGNYEAVQRPSRLP